MGDEAMPGWDWFPAPENPSFDANRSAPATPDVSLAFLRCFRGPDGESVLAHLRALTLERALGPDASEPRLRHLEGQRQLVSYIAAMIDRGRQARRTPHPAHSDF